jgi:transposase-like protein
VDTPEPDLRDGRERRRRHSAEFKASVVAKCAIPGVSIAAVALRHGLNANLVRRWVTEARAVASDSSQRETPEPERDMTVPVAGFVPVRLDSALPTKAAIEVELRRGPVAAKVSWPISAARECGLWLRELLK